MEKLTPLVGSQMAAVKAPSRACAADQSQELKQNFAKRLLKRGGQHVRIRIGFCASK